ncbi:RUN domain-containing protein 3B-like [Ptychodera flava]|uniref:RUN domain-containing protein 3B-like n=1 Tax=Ptychodera flava TaxID=63121 RepID=UPI00396A5BE8
MSAPDSRAGLVKRQDSIRRHNLLCVCRLAVKSLIDKSCFESIEDSCEEFVNFTVILEQILSFKLKDQTWWFIVDEPRCFWNYIRVACRKLPNNCIKSIQAMENVKSSKAKGRAWIRLALMEKRLSEYIATALKEERLTKSFYDNGAIMLGDDVHILTGLLLGLNAIDFSFCLKGEDLELKVPDCVDYTPYMKFQQCPESICSDEEEIKSLSSHGDSGGQDIEDDEDDSIEMKFNRLQNKYKMIQQQKGYLEELVRLRESQLLESQKQQQRLIKQIEDIDIQARAERQQFETVILELQEQLFLVTESPRKQLENHLTGQWQTVDRQKRANLPMIAMENIKASIEMIPAEQMVPHTDIESIQSLEQSNSDVPLPSPTSISSTDKHAELRNMIRELQRDKEETPSLVPLTGSLTSQVSLKSAEINLHSSSSSVVSSDNQPQSVMSKSTDQTPGSSKANQDNISNTS